MSPYLGVTVDQLIAQKYGQDTILSSLQLGVEEDGNFGNCNWGYSCAYTNSVSWTSPVAAVADGSESARSLRAPVRRWHQPGRTSAGARENASILDSVTQEIAYFKRPLGEGDKQRLDTYLENIREIERRIRIAMESTVKNPPTRSLSVFRKTNTFTIG